MQTVNGFPQRQPATRSPRGTERRGRTGFLRCMPRKCEGNTPPMRPTLGMSISTTATSTPTTRATTTQFGWCEAERGKSSSGGIPPAAPSFDLRSLVQAFDACRRGKKATDETIRYAAHLLDHLLATRDALADFSWKPSRSRAFVCTRPKLREIHAAPFGDRVVHHLLVKQWERLYEPIFIFDSYANRCGKGTHAAVNRLQTMMRSLRGSGIAGMASPAAAMSARHMGWSLHLDVRSFFHSLDRRVLLALLARRLRGALRQHRISRPAALALWRHTCAVLADEPAQTATRLGSKHRFDAIPPHKRLGHGGTGIGLPIGNLTSQFFGNVVLNELDHFIKRRLKVKRYVRYVDDFVLLHESREQLNRWHDAIAIFLREQLHLELRDAGRLRPLGNGVDFLGFVIRCDYRLVRRRIVRRVWSELARFEAAWLRFSPEASPERWHGAQAPQSLPRTRSGARNLHRHPASPGLQHLQNRLASWLAHFRHADAGRLWARLVRRFQWLQRFFMHPERALRDGLIPRWRLPQGSAARTLGQQVRAFSRINGARFWLVQVGKRWWWMSAQGRIVQADMTHAQAARWWQAWCAQGVACGVLGQDGWQRDGKRQRVLTALNGTYRAPQRRAGP